MLSGTHSMRSILNCGAIRCSILRDCPKLCGVPERVKVGEGQRRFDRT
jgi:hypothetical protein